MFTWRREGSRDTSEPLAGPEGAPGELERDWGQGMEGQDTGNGFPLGKGRPRWDIGKEFLAVRVERPWNRVPREAVDSGCAWSCSPGNSAPLPCPAETPPAELPQPWGTASGGCGAAGESPEEAMELLQGWSPSGARLGELGMFTWRREGSKESSEPLPGPKGAPGELERDFGRGLE